MAHYTFEATGEAPKEPPHHYTFLKECPDLKIDWVQHLRTHGWAIVKGVVPKERCDHFYSGMWDFMARFGTGIDRNLRETWSDANWPAALHGGLMHNHGVGHEQFVWDARLEEGVIKIFSTLWGTEELLVSFDGINLSRPNLKTTAPWQHTDQSGYTKGFACAQGILNLLPNGPNDGGLIVLDKSHLRHEEFFKQNPHRLHEVDWCKIREPELPFYAGCEEIKLCADPGDFFVFDSRTIHYACGPQGETPRAAIYICMLPASLATPEQIAAKKAAFNNKRMTSHWPHKVYVFDDVKPSEDGRITGKPVNPDLPVLSERAKQLAGLIPYH